MWMLNYPFPYEDAKVAAAFDAMCRALHATLTSTERSNREQLLEAYRAARAKFADAVSAGQYAYFSFQMWQEGVARYTEYAVAARTEGVYRPSIAFAGLKDVVPFGDDARATRDNVLTQLSAMSLKKAGRVSFYAVGAGEALLLDKAKPRWRERYLSDPFYLERYFEPAVGQHR
jgi:hypothetical protein